MWAEARKQERKIRGIMVDHKKRAERRREYYEKIKQDPAQFMQITGRACKLHIDHNASGSEPSNTIMPWQGNANILIDRFDVRAHLDYIPEVQNDGNTYCEESKEMRPMNYERYRILIQNNFLKVKEEKFLKTLALEEKYGGKTYQQQKAEEDKKKAEKGKAAIGFNYEDSSNIPTSRETSAPSADLVPSDSDDEFDLDTVINFSALSRDQQHELNNIGKTFFLGKEDFVKYLKQEADEQEVAKTVKAEEDEKSAFSGRKSRKERRILKEKRLAGRIPSPPSYATYDNNDKKKSFDDSSSEDSSRSNSPEQRRSTGKVEYITTFGEETPSKRSSKDKRSKKRGRRHRSSSSSSSSDDARGGSKYRSKYRRKRRSSSSSSEDGNNGNAMVVQPPPPPPIKRYYGRKRDDSEEDKLTEDEETSELKTECSSYQMYSREDSNGTKSTVSASRSNLPKPGSVQSFKEKLKKRMQSQLQKHYKADKRAEIDRKIKQEEARVMREEELKEIIRKVKAKRGSDSDSSSDSADEKTRHRSSRRSRSRSSSSSRSSGNRRHHHRRRSRSRSRSRDRYRNRDRR